MGLPHPGNARFRADDIVITLAHIFLFPGQIRSWPDQAHFSFKNIDKLRKLIKTGPPEKITRLRDPRIVFELFVFCILFTDRFILFHELIEDLFGIRDHGPEFVDRKGSAVFSDPGLGKEQRIAVPLLVIEMADI